MKYTIFYSPDIPRKNGYTKTRTFSSELEAIEYCKAYEKRFNIKVTINLISQQIYIGNID